MVVIPALRKRLKQKDQEFEACLGYIAKPVSKKRHSDFLKVFKV
jgi:hypothetical protein